MKINYQMYLTNSFFYKHYKTERCKRLSIPLVDYKRDFVLSMPLKTSISSSILQKAFVFNVFASERAYFFVLYEYH